jgi:hypothetical protein
MMLLIFIFWGIHGPYHGVAPLPASIHSPDKVTLISQTFPCYQQASIAPKNISTYPPNHTF